MFKIMLFDEVIDFSSSVITVRCLRTNINTTLKCPWELHDCIVQTICLSSSLTGEM